MTKALFTLSLLMLSILGYSQLTLTQEQTIDSLNQLIEESEYDTLIAKAYLSLSAIYSVSNPDTTIILLKKTERLIKHNLKSPSLKKNERKSFRLTSVRVSNNKASHYYKKGDVSRALSIYLKCLKIAEEINEKALIASAYNNIAVIYRKNIKDMIKALNYNMKALKIRIELGDKRAIALSLQNIAVVYQTMGQSNTALEYHFKSLSMRKSIAHKFGIARSLFNIGLIYGANNDDGKAFDYFQQSLKIAEELSAQTQIEKCLRNMSRLFSKKGDIKQAVIFAKRSVEISEEINSPHHIAQASWVLSRALREAADSSKISSQKKADLYKEALHYSVIYNELVDSLNDAKVMGDLVKQETKYAYEKEQIEIKAEYEKQLILREQKVLRQKIYLIVAIFTLLLLGFLTFFIYKNYRQRKQLDASKIEIANTNLTNSALQIIQNDKFLKEIDNLLRDMEKEGEVKKRDALIKEFKNNIRINKTEIKRLNNFQEQFEVANNDFIARLKKSTPKLTSQELRICTLIKMYVGSREISSILGVSTESLKTYRHRTHKKLELSKGVKLFDYVQSV